MHDLRAALSDPQAYSRPPASVEVRETHVSLLFFAGDRVYKVKKAVRFPFVDASTRERRLFLCREEVRLNRRLAPHVYLGVVPVVALPGGRVRVGGEGEAVEHAVEMVRLPDDGMLDGKLARGEVDDALLRDLAALLADFHARAATGPGVDEHGDPAVVRSVVLGNLRDAEPQLPAWLTARLRDAAEAWLDEHDALLRARVAAGRVRDGHGDLHAGNVCVTPQGVVAYDCIEFSPRLRCGDVAFDLAFLLMDFDHRALCAFGRHLAKEYARLAGDADVARLLAFGKLHRACVRGTVGFLGASDRGDALARFHLAAGYTLPPALVLTCGLPACGKSWAAERLASPLRAALLRSDLVRKRLVGVPPTRRWRGGFAEGPYDPSVTERTYGALLEAVRRELAAGRGAVVDATFARASWRRRFLDVAQATGAPHAVVRLRCDEETTRARLAQRERDPREVSDAGLEVYLRARELFEPPDEVAAPVLVEADGAGPAHAVVDAALRGLAAQAPARVQ